LKLASKWASEQLNGLASSDAMEESSGAEEDVDLISMELIAMNSLEVYAKTLLDLGEYHRAASVLSAPPSTATATTSASSAAVAHMKSGSVVAAIAAGSGQGAGGDVIVHPPRDNLSHFGIYIRAYALYMAGERRKEEEMVELRDPLERTALRNSYLSQLAEELHQYSNSNLLDVFGLYIYGVVLKEIQRSPPGLGGSKHRRSTTESRGTGFQANASQDIINQTPTLPPAHIILHVTPEAD